MSSKKDLIVTDSSNDEVHVGDTILIVSYCPDARVTGYHPTGVVEHIDDIGQIHGTWGGVALVSGEDCFYIIKKGGRDNG